MDSLKAKQDVSVTKLKFSRDVKKEELMSLPGIQEVKQLELGEWMLKSSNSADLSKELMSFALQHNLNIVSLQAQTRQLEEIFRQLTGN